MKEHLDATLPHVLDAFLDGYFCIQAMLYRTYFHPLPGNLQTMTKAKKMINLMGFSDEDIITAAIINPNRYYEIKRRVASDTDSFVELQSFYSFVNSLNEIDETEDKNDENIK